MLNQIRKTAVGLVAAGFVFATSLTGVSAQEPVAESVNVNAANGLVAAVVAVQDVFDNNGTIDVAVVELNDSLNDLRVLNNVLNDNDVDITVYDVVDVQNVLNDLAIDVNIEDFLNNNNIALTDVVGVGILSGGDIIVFTQG